VHAAMHQRPTQTRSNNELLYSRNDAKDRAWIIQQLCYLCQRILQGCRYRDRPRLRVQPLLEDRSTSRRTPPAELHSRSQPPDSDARRRQRHRHGIPRQRCMEWKLRRLADGVADGGPGSPVGGRTFSSASLSGRTRARVSRFQPSAQSCGVDRSIPVVEPQPPKHSRKRAKLRRV
jgi:hypothetical protein